MYIFTKNVAGNAAEVRNLVPPGVGVHEYQFKPEDVKKISDSDMVVKSGLGAEAWLEKLLKSAGKQDLTLIDTSLGIKALKPGEKIPVEIKEGSTLKKEVERGIGGVDVHIWLDPLRAMKQVENIRDGLSKRDPTNKRIYDKNAAAYLNRLRRLDTNIKLEVATFKTRDFVAFHSAFIYFSDRYGLNQVAAIEPFPGKEPNPRYLAEISGLVKQKKIKALFTEPQFSPRIVDSLAGDLKVEVLVLDPLETGDLRVDYYEELMRKNVRNLKKAMGR